MNRSPHWHWVERVDAWDRKWIQKLNGKPGTRRSKFFHAFSFFGRETPWLLLTEFFLFVYFIPEVYLAFGCSLLYGIGIVYVLKRITLRPRPWKDLPSLHVLDGPNSSHSFPSWHTYNLVAGSCLLTYFLHSWYVLVIGLIAAAILAYSRIYLGVHYPTDVIAGYLAGFLGFFLTVWTLPYWLIALEFCESIIFPFTVTHGWNMMFAFWWYWPAVAGVFLFLVYGALYRRFNRKDLANWDKTKAKIVITPQISKS